MSTIPIQQIYPEYQNLDWVVSQINDEQILDELISVASRVFNSTNNVIVYSSKNNNLQEIQNFADKQRIRNIIIVDRFILVCV